MKYFLSLAAAGFLLSLVQAKDEDAVKAEVKKFQGVWKVTEAYDKGDKVPAEDLRSLEVIFEGNKILVREGDKVHDRMTFQINPAKKPKTIDMTHAEGPNKGRTDPGIYLLEGNSLKICVNEKKGGARPTEFASKRGSSVSLIVLKRVGN